MTKWAEFTIKGKHYRISDDQVREGLAQEEPERIWDLAAWVDGRWFPVKQALVKPIGRENGDVNSRFAVRQLTKLGLRIHDSKLQGPLPAAPSSATSAASRIEALRLAVGLLQGSGATAGQATAAAEEMLAWLAA